MIFITHILSLLKDITFRGDENSQILKLVQIDELKDINELAWCSETNNEKLLSLKKGTVICSAKTPESYFKTSVNYILCEDPRMAFKSVIEHFFIDENITHSIASSCKISEKAKIAKNVYIGENCIIEDDVVIGNNCIIKHNNIIHKGTIIGDNVKIDLNELIAVERTEDSGNSLWTVFNRVQEKLITGGCSYKMGAKMRKARAVKNFSQDLKINEALWELAEEYIGG